MANNVLDSPLCEDKGRLSNGDIDLNALGPKSKEMLKGLLNGLVSSIDHEETELEEVLVMEKKSSRTGKKDKLEAGDGLDKEDYYVRLYTLAPFLFGFTNLDEKWINLLRESGLLCTKKREESVEPLSEREMEIVDLVDASLTVVFKHWGKYNGKHYSDKETKVLTMFDKFEKADLKTLTYKTILQEASRHETFTDLWKKFQPEFRRTDLYKFSLVYVLKQYYTLVKTSSDLVRETAERFSAEIQSAQKWKALGNKDFKECRFQEAVKNYTKAIDLCHFSNVLYGNRAQANLNLRRFREAISDAKRAVAIKPEWVKGQYRYAQACIELKMFDAAQEANAIARRVAQSKPKDNEIKDVLQQQERIAEERKKPIDGYDSDDVPELVSTDDDDDDDDNDDLHEDQELMKATEAKHAEYKWKFTNHMRDGSIALLNKKSREAARCYQESLDLLAKHGPDYLGFDDVAEVVLKYSYGMACVDTAGYKLLRSGLRRLESCVQSNKAAKVPIVYHGLGVIYIALFRFQEAKIQVTCGLNLVNQRDFGMLEWPGTNKVIECTKQGKLKEALRELLRQCSYPPSPDGICRYLQCDESGDRQHIYFEDPEFKGLIRILCWEQCRVDFHNNCWKRYKLSFGDRLTDRDMLDKRCPTDACSSLIYRIIIYRPENLPDGKSITSDSKHTTETKWNKPKVKMVKVSAAKVLRKQEKLERRKELRRLAAAESNSRGVDINHLLKVTEKKSMQDEMYKSMKEAVSDDRGRSTGEAGNVTVLKKEEDELDDKQKGKVKQRPKKRKDKLRTTLSMEVNFNDRKEETLQGEHSVYDDGDGQGHRETIPRFHRSTPNPTSPFSVPDSLRAEIRDFEQNYRSSNGTGKGSNCKAEPLAVVDQVSENLYSYFTDILQANGPQAMDDVVMQQELELFPEEAKKVIKDSGGLRSFLLGSLKFRAVDDVVCLVRDLPKAKELAEERKHGLGMQVVRSRRANRLANAANNLPGKQKMNLNPSAPEFMPSIVSNSYRVLENNENPVHSLKTSSVSEMTSGATNITTIAKPAQAETNYALATSVSNYTSVGPQPSQTDLDGFTLPKSKNRKKGAYGLDPVGSEQGNNSTATKTAGKPSYMDLDDISEPLKIRKMFAEEDDTSSDTSSVSRPASARGLDPGLSEGVDSLDRTDDATSTCSGDSLSSESTKRHLVQKGVPKPASFSHKPLTLPNPGTAGNSSPLLPKDLLSLNGIRKKAVPDMDSIDDGSDEEVTVREPASVTTWSNGDDSSKENDDSKNEGSLTVFSSASTSGWNSVSTPLCGLGPTGVSINSSNAGASVDSVSSTSSVWSSWNTPPVQETLKEIDSNDVTPIFSPFGHKDLKQGMIFSNIILPHGPAQTGTPAPYISQAAPPVVYPPSLQMPTMITMAGGPSNMALSPPETINALSVMNMSPPAGPPLVTAGNPVRFPISSGPSPELSSVPNSHLTDYMKQHYLRLSGPAPSNDTGKTDNMPFPNMGNVYQWSPPNLNFPPPSLVGGISDVNLTFGSGDPMGLSGFGPYKISPPMNIVESGTQTETTERFEKAVNTDPMETFRGEYEAAKAHGEMLEGRLREAATHYTQLHETATQKLQELTALVNEVDASRKGLETENASLKSHIEMERQQWNQEKEGFHQQIQALQQELQTSQQTCDGLEGQLRERDQEKAQILQKVQEEREKQTAMMKELIKQVKDQLTTQTNRARNAEVEVLKVRLLSGMLVLERVLKEANFHLARLEGFAKKAHDETSAVPPQLKQAIDSWRTMTNKCTQIITKSEIEFEEQIQKVQGGEELANLPPLRVPSPPPPPQMPVPQRGPPGQPGPADGADRSQSPQQLASSMGQSDGPAGLGTNAPLTLLHPLQGATPLNLLRQPGTSTTGHPPPLRPLVPPSGSLPQPSPLKPLVPPMGVPGSRVTTSGLGPGQLGIGTQQPPKNSFGKLIVMLQRMFPNYSRVQFTQLIQELRTRSGGSLSGMTLDQIVQKVADRIVEMENYMRAKALKGVGNTSPGNSRPPPGLSSEWSSAGMGVPVSVSSEVFEEEEDPCVICHEEMTPMTAMTLECRHRFHEQCIKKWFNEQSTCPNCRTHTLLPDDFPNLK